MIKRHYWCKYLWKDNSYYDILKNLSMKRDSMIQRCYNKKNNIYHRYWGKWIVVEERWKDKATFMKDMVDIYIEHYEKYWRKDTTLDRINPYWPYSLENCRFATNYEQQINKKKIHKIEWKPLSEYAKDKMINKNTIRQRFYNGLCLSTPVKDKKIYKRWEVYYSLLELSKMYSVSYHLLYDRIKKLKRPVRKALITPNLSFNQTM
jgi:Mor family transcriptional regulator